MACPLRAQPPRAIPESEKLGEFFRAATRMNFALALTSGKIKV